MDLLKYDRFHVNNFFLIKLINLYLKSKKI